MHDIGQITPSIYIGGVGAIEHIEWLSEQDITHVLKLYPDEPYWPENFTVHELPMDDGVHIPSSMMQEGVTFIEDAIRSNAKILVVCGLGISRSVTFVLAYLTSQGYDLRDAFDLVRMGRPQAWPAPQLWESLISFSNAPYTLRDVYTWLTRKN